MSEPTPIYDHGDAAQDRGGSAGGANGHQEGGTHYVRMQVQPWDVIDTWPTEQRVGFYRGNALKYLMRLGTKDAQVLEARKARHYIDKLIETLEAQ